MLIDDVDWDKGPEHVNGLIASRVAAVLEKYAKAADVSETDLSEDQAQPPPIVPPANPAAIRPVLVDGRLVLPPSEPPTITQADMLAALEVLRAVIIDLRAEAAATAQADRRFLDRMRAIADRVPPSLPDGTTLMRLGHDMESLGAYAETVRSEWPGHLHADYAGMLSQFRRTLRHFPAWRAFEDGDPGPPLDDSQIAAAADLASAVADELEAAEIAPQVDAAIPAVLRTLGTDLADRIAAAHAQFDASLQSAQSLTRDVLQSISNTLKPLIDATVDILRHSGQVIVVDTVEGGRKLFAPVGVASTEVGKLTKTSVAAFWKSYKAQLPKAATKASKAAADTTSSFIGKALKRIARAAAKVVKMAAFGFGAAAGIGAGAKLGLAGQLASLIDKFPSVFGWLKPFLDLLLF